MTSLQRAAAFAQRALRLEDWQLDVEVSDRPPRWCASRKDFTKHTIGLSEAWIDHKVARIWVSPARTRAQNQARFSGESVSTVQVLFHEIAHVLFDDCGWKLDGSVGDESVVDRVAEVMERAWKGCRRSQ